MSAQGVSQGAIRRGRGRRSLSLGRRLQKTSHREAPAAATQVPQVEGTQGNQTQPSQELTSFQVH